MLPALTVTDATGAGDDGETVTVVAPVTPSAVALIAADPAATAVTMPALDTDATSGFVLDHVTGLLMMLPPASRRTAVACVACCAGPILGVLGAIAGLGLAAGLVLGIGALVVAGAVLGLVVILIRRRRATAARPVTDEPVPVSLGRPKT